MAFIPKCALALIILGTALFSVGCGSDEETKPASSPSSTAQVTPPTSTAPFKTDLYKSNEVTAPGTADSSPSTAVTDPASVSSASAPSLVADDQLMVALVNGVPISRRLFESQQVMSEAGRGVFEDKSSENESARKASDLTLKLEVINGLVGLELACQEALARGYSPTEAELETAMTALQSDFVEPSQLHKSLDQYGQTIEELRQYLTKTLALQKWQKNEFLPQMVVTEKDARDFYEQNKVIARHPDMVRVSQIFFGVPLASLAEAKEKVKAKGEKALARLKAGHDLQAVALEVSDDPDVGRTGGDLGWIAKRDSALPFFATTVFNLKPGETSELLESPLGYYIFKVEDTKAAGTEPFEAMRSRIVEHLSSEKLTRAMTSKMDELYGQAEIEIYEPQLKKAFNEYLAAENKAQE